MKNTKNFFETCKKLIIDYPYHTKDNKKKTWKWDCDKCINNIFPINSKDTYFVCQKCSLFQKIPIQYFYNCDKYDKIYDKCIVLIEVGSFYEAYGVNGDNFELGHATKLGQILNIMITKKDKNKFRDIKKSLLEKYKNMNNIPENILNSINFQIPLMAGITTPALDKYLKILIERGYTVILIEQGLENNEDNWEKIDFNKLEKYDEKKDKTGNYDGNVRKRIVRKVSRIVSPGTYMDICSNDSNNMVSIFIERINEEKDILSIGLSCIDLTTGRSNVYEVMDKKYDKNYALDETIRYILSNDPKEIIINMKDYKISKQKLISRLNLYNINTLHIFDDYNKEYEKINYQEKMFENIFHNNKILTPIEDLNLERYHQGRLSYIFLLNHCNNHDNNIIVNIKKPKINTNLKYLQLDTTTINQLNLCTRNVESNYKIQYNSLFDVINYTSNALGRRLLKEKLLNPIFDINNLNERYEMVNDMIKKENYKKYEKKLILINDLERVHRKISLLILNPDEIDNLLSSYEEIPKLIKLIKKNKNIKKFFNKNLKNLENINNYINEYISKLDLKEAKKYKITNIENSFFKEGANKEIDEIQNNINKNYLFLKKFNTKVHELILKGSTGVGKNNSKLKSTLDKYKLSGEYFIKFTNVNSKCLKEGLKKLNKFNVDGKIILKEDIEIKKKDGSNKMICHEEIEKASNEIYKYTKMMKQKAREFYEKILKDIYEKYKDLMKDLEYFVAELDVIKSAAKCAIINNYVKPVCKESEESYINSKNMRHPIVEKLIDYPYVENNCILDNKENGIVLYGVNGVGKSVFLKSIGLNVILAQSGNYVACKSFEFSPFTRILTRILGNDNIFTHSSSFQIEMNELRSILLRADKKSLVLSDELCRGTEFCSATSLVASAIVDLSERNSKFVLTTHLHKLCNLEEIKNLENVSIKHMTVSFKGEKMIYDRKIEDGTLNNVSYGITIADKLGLGEIPNFIERAEKVRKKLMNQNEEIVPVKKSRYNVKLYINMCEICKNKKAEDTHHIKFQEFANNKGYFKDEYYHKNNICNLLPVCKECHDKIHNGDLVINKKIKTSEGIELDKKIKIDT